MLANLNNNLKMVASKMTVYQRKSKFMQFIKINLKLVAMISGPVIIPRMLEKEIMQYQRIEENYNYGKNGTIRKDFAKMLTKVLSMIGA